jgi:hypothetical protein
MSGIVPVFAVLAELLAGLLAAAGAVAPSASQARSMDGA